ncbi:MAG: protein-glutamate O-methyltransferase CheR [Hyphomonadaceae bacterium]
MGRGGLTEADLAYITREMRARTGCRLTLDDADLIETRIAPIARREGFLSIQDLITTVRARRDERLIAAICEQLLSTDTHFFRDRAAFAYFSRTLFPALAARRSENERVRIWSAGCAGGQEPYSIAIAVEERRLAGLEGDCEVIANDISTRVIEKARTGAYTQFEVQRGLPIRMLVRHFEKTGDSWLVNDRIRAKVRLHSFNLLADPVSFGQFDVIFCRNVLCAFGEEERAATLARLLGALSPQGALILGDGESLEIDGFAPIAAAPSIFLRADARRQAA